MIKIKKHFSLFMVQKTIKKPNNKEISDDSHKEEKYPSIPKFIDPINCFHLYGDIIFQDKLKEKDVGLMSQYHDFRHLINLQFNDECNIWTTEFSTPSYELDSWKLIYDRLMTLGSTPAFELAKTIDMIFISTEIQVKPEKDLKIKMPELTSQVNYQNYLKEVEKELRKKRNGFHLFLMYDMHSLKRGLELNKMGYSKPLIDLVWEEESWFVDYTLKFYFYDFLTIERERYFDYIKNNILSMKTQSNCMEVKFCTLEGIFTHLTPVDSTKFCLDEHGNVLGLFLIFEFPLQEKFLNLVAKSREKRTKISKRKKKREDVLEDILNFYYVGEKFFQNTQYNKGNTKNEVLYKSQDQNQKRCGFRNLE